MTLPGLDSGLRSGVPVNGVREDGAWRLADVANLGFRKHRGVTFVPIHNDILAADLRTPPRSLRLHRKLDRMQICLDVGACDINFCSVALSVQARRGERWGGRSRMRTRSMSIDPHRC